MSQCCATLVFQIWSLFITTDSVNFFFKIFSSCVCIGPQLSAREIAWDPNPKTFFWAHCLGTLCLHNLWHQFYYRLTQGKNWSLWWTKLSLHYFVYFFFVDVLCLILVIHTIRVVVVLITWCQVEQKMIHANTYTCSTNRD